MDYLEHRDRALADNEDLQEGLLKVKVQRYWHHDKKGDKRMAQAYLRQANELANKYGLQDFLSNLLNV